MEDNPLTQEQLISIAERALLRNYRQPPLVMTRGEGVWLWDKGGKRYLDLTAGIAVCVLGHGHPALTRVLQAQAQKLLHVSNLFYIEEQILTAQAIVERSFGDRVFFCNSGAEANEAALKLARRYQHVVANNSQRDTIVSTLGSFHGRSFATLATTGQQKYREGFGSLLSPVRFVPFGDLEAAQAALRSQNACAFLVEPIQAEGGIVEAPPGYWAGLRRIADENWDSFNFR